MSTPSNFGRLATLPQRTAAAPARSASLPQRVLDVKREPQQLSLFGRPAGNIAGSTRTG